MSIAFSKFFVEVYSQDLFVNGVDVYEYCDGFDGFDEESTREFSLNRLRIGDTVEINKPLTVQNTIVLTNRTIVLGSGTYEVVSFNEGLPVLTNTSE